MLYMQEVERMDGYGEESYPAKVSMAQRWAWLPGLSRWVSGALRGQRGGPGTPCCAEAGDVQKSGNLKAEILWPEFHSKTHSCFAVCSLKCSWSWVPSGAQCLLSSYVLTRWLLDTSQTLPSSIGLLSIFCLGNQPRELGVVITPVTTCCRTAAFCAFSFQDSQGSDISIGACLEGIFVKHKNGRPPVIFRYFSYTRCARSVASPGDSVYYLY